MGPKLRVLVDNIFATGCFAVLLTALAFVAEGGFNPIAIGPLLGVAVMCALLFRKIRFWSQLKYGKLGLMKPGFRWKLRQSDRASMLEGPARSAEGTDALAEDHPRRVVADALQVFRDRWTERDPERSLSDDEIRSLYFLYSYADPSGEDRRSAPAKLLREIHDRTPFLKIRERIDAWYAARASEREAYQEWLKKIGGGSMNHLLDSGWKNFLTSQPSVDSELWHCIAANTDRIEENGRLRAAFWILAQPQCDKATASDFIRGFIRQRHLDAAVKRKDAETVANFARVIRRYNSGFYKIHAIRSGRFAKQLEGYGDEAVARDLSRMEARRKLPALPRPEGLLDRSATPPDQRGEGYTSALAFSPEKGLHLRPPNHDWTYAS